METLRYDDGSFRVIKENDFGEISTIFSYLGGEFEMEMEEL